MVVLDKYRVHRVEQVVVVLVELLKEAVVHQLLLLV
tara:strand:+ start:390 stop:497 length:108 start_codon:yes stop_codon:yes gene_type:complete